jgi:hypothetical protein|tara:strand:- start:164 stop:553 length:390 start_codon:yes stop_codon:yes gene_type:complete
MTLIRNVDHIKQPIDFTGLQNGKLHPTDIDAVLEFDNEAVIFMELKDVKSSGIPVGQRLLLERLVDSWHTSKSIAMNIVHNQLGSEPIHIHLCDVVAYYMNGKWYDSNINVKDALNKLGKHWEIKKLKF